MIPLVSLPAVAADHPGPAGERGDHAASYTTPRDTTHVLTTHSYAATLRNSSNDSVGRRSSRLVRPCIVCQGSASACVRGARAQISGADCALLPKKVPKKVPN